jgi:hypothetical protein
MKSIVVVVAVLMITACSQSYEDCILENMKSAGSNVAAHVISRACAVKYKSEEVEEAKPAEENKDYSPTETQSNPFKEFDNKYGQ